MADTSLIGKAKELQIAALLTELGFQVFLPLVDKGFDLVITNTSGKRFIPVQVKYRTKDPSLTLGRSDIHRFKNKMVLLVFIIGVGKDKRIWFIPFEDWLLKSQDNKRHDKKIFVNVRRNAKWLSQYEYPQFKLIISKMFKA